ncbi:hypothetical protein HBI22_038480 [Parastagonospora nodorum]|nr:hypothetical protein HBI28_025910 [Parastagonospora nodorum]KAH5644589.1 hypothetical protein HBI22_038480 [Parastagonospora nodorum]
MSPDVSSRSRKFRQTLDPQSLNPARRRSRGKIACAPVLMLACNWSSVGAVEKSLELDLRGAREASGAEQCESWLRQITFSIVPRVTGDQ